MNNLSFLLLSILFFSLFLESCSNFDPQEEQLLGDWYDELQIFPERTSYAAVLHLGNSPANQSLFLKNREEYPLKIEGKNVYFELPDKGIYYHGIISEDTTLIQGMMVEGRNAFPLEMHYRKSVKAEKTLRKFIGVFRLPLQTQGIRLSLNGSIWGKPTGKIDIPGLEVQNIPIEQLSISGKKLSFSCKRLQLSFDGEFAPDSTIRGNWNSSTVILRNRTLAQFRRRNLSARPVLPEYNSHLPKASPEEARLSREKLAQLINELNNGAAPFLDGIVLMRNDRLVLERYYNGYNGRTPHALSGISRSITSLLAGVALPDSLLTDLHEPISSYLNIPGDSEHAAITVHQLMTMSSGLACNDWSRTSFSNRTKMLREKNWIDYMLRIPVADTPGSSWADCGGNGVLLTSIIERVTGKPLQTLANEKLFKPLRISSARWEHDSFANPDGGSGMFMAAYDLARIGGLLLNKGKKRTEQLIPEKWIETIWQKQIDLEAGAQSEYGYFWWSKNISHNGVNVKLHYAAGMGGQYLIIVPRYRMVVVFFGNDIRNKQLGKPFELLQNYILPAVVE